MKKHKHLIDHNTLESTAQKVDSSTAAMDRHATASAVSRDDRENADSTPQATPQDSSPTPSTQDSSPTSTKAVTPTLTPSQQDSRIFALESRALQGERGDKTNGLSHKRAAAITDSSQKAESSILCACSEFVYLGSLPYTLRLPTGKTYPLHQGDSFIVPQGDLSRYLEYKSTMFKKLR